MAKLLLRIVFLSLLLSEHSVAQQKNTSNCINFIEINDSSTNTTLTTSKIQATVQFKNKNRNSTLNFPCETWSLLESQTRCDTINLTAPKITFNKQGSLILSESDLFAGRCNCFSCSWKSRTFDSISAPLMVVGHNCDGKIEINRKKKVNSSLPLWLQQDYKSGDYFNLTNILFWPNKSMLIKSSFEELELLYDLLIEQKSLKIQISGHVNGPKQNNSKEFQELSENRAKVVLDYLIKKGINSSRLTYKGFGNTQMLFENPSSEEEMKANRRVEIKVL